MYVRAISIRLLRGRSTPAKRAMRSTLPLLVPLVLADHAHDASPANDLALVANLFDRCSDLHIRAPITRNTTGLYSLESTIGPSSVMATECSKWAERLPSLVTAVQPSSFMTTSGPPAFTMGSIATTSPAESRRPLPASP